ncbi:AraC family transcriptional regulator [Paenibacillus sp. JSM ZJ436]|uniref:AraC family transcriptional regulator n=1 Tax=Paenibacillus algicola TaxID=2565926 RepID=A0A4P8XGA9_9BACL|nr:AraC family transcriptional regulator [Paenibacillus algicola]QCT01517.1 AraC family transcriptional regulator [Paenibacillus algicola]
MSCNDVLVSVADIAPVILRSARNVLTPGFTTGERVIPHYQIQYIQDGFGTISIDDKEYKMRKGMLCFWGPGTKHQISSDPNQPLIILGIQFHMSHTLQPVRFTDFSGFPPVTIVHAQARIEALLRDIVKEYMGQRIYWEESAGALCKTLLLLLARQSIMSDGEGDVSWQMTEMILKFIEENYREPLTNEAIAKQFHFHPAHVNKLVITSTGVSLHQYLMNFRISQAVELLLSTSMSIQEIADAVGYKNIHYFSRIYKKKMGISPTMTRRQALSVK